MCLACVVPHGTTEPTAHNSTHPVGVFRLAHIPFGVAARKPRASRETVPRPVTIRSADRVSVATEKNGWRGENLSEKFVCLHYHAFERSQPSSRFGCCRLGLACFWWCSGRFIVEAANSISNCSIAAARRAVVLSTGSRRDEDECVFGRHRNQGHTRKRQRI